MVVSINTVSLKLWSFYNPVHLIAGRGALKQLPRFIGEGRVLLVTTPGFSERGLTGAIKELLPDRELVVLDNVKPIRPLMPWRGTQNNWKGLIYGRLWLSAGAVQLIRPRF